VSARALFRTFAVIAILACGAAFLGFHRAGVALGALALLVLGGHVALTAPTPAVRRPLVAGAVLLAAALAAQLWRPVQLIDLHGRTIPVPSLAGPRLTGVLVLLAVLALMVAVLLLPRRPRSPAPGLIAGAVALLPVAAAVTDVADALDPLRSRSAADLGSFAAATLPAALAVVLVAATAVAAARRASGRLLLLAGALLIEMIAGKELGTVAQLWDFVDEFTRPRDAFLSVGVMTAVVAPSGLPVWDPSAGLLAVALTAGPALLAIGAGRNAQDA
jgi:hypothetical protein